MKFLKKKFNQMVRSSLITSTLLIIIGILLIAKPEEILSLISIIIGIGLVIIGIFGVINYIRDFKDDEPFSLDIIYGVICLIVGSILITNTKIVGSILPIVLGVWMVINSIIKAEYAMIIKDSDNKDWKITFIFSILALICGILFIFNPFKGAELITQIIGSILVFYSLIDIINIIILKKDIKDFKDEIKKTKKEIEKDIKEAEYEEIEKDDKKSKSKNNKKKK